MKLPGMAVIPTIRQFGDAIYVLPDAYGYLGDRPVEYQASQAMAGPFPDRWAAARWIVGHLETRLSPRQLPIWADLLERARGLTADPYHLIGLLGGMLYGMPIEKLQQSAGPALAVDRKRLAAGERESTPF